MLSKIIALAINAKAIVVALQKRSKEKLKSEKKAKKVNFTGSNIEKYDIAIGTIIVAPKLFWILGAPISFFAVCIFVYYDVDFFNI